MQLTDSDGEFIEPYLPIGGYRHLRKRRIKAVIPEKGEQAANRKKKGSGRGRLVSHDADCRS
ncbi:hypothetical protein [Streptomyces sp. SAI-170]|uniref:hypothetical protein n=1 Tax=Streptomyces sp. SAI-170 TaxID=3377729 RepID=UPI003C7A0D3A